MAKHSRLTRAITLCVLIVIMLSSIFTVYLSANSRVDYGSSPSIQNINGGSIYTGIENYYDSSVIYKLPDTIKADEEISLIINLDTITLLDAYNNAKTDGEYKDFAATDEAGEIASNIRDESNAIISVLQSKGIDFELGHSYNTVLAGFEITITAEDFKDVCMAVGDRADVVVGEVYNTADTRPVENTVDVKETGIFNSAGFGYDGTGMLVAVLDTGLDYYHEAFLPENFKADRSKLHLTFNGLSGIMSAKSMSAEERYPGLTASDVYINEKVPYGFDYADNDPDVFPIHSNHGTHVAGIIAGGETYIEDEGLDFVGVAPNAQLAIMKIFSDIEDTARTSWIVAALEDCVNLGVDVINMSIGTSCGFSRESDAEVISGVYDRIREQGISMVVAASNSYSSAYGSDKNGSYPLTSNPDSSTVGSPSTYLGTMSVASIQGAKTPYITFNNQIIYFTESTDRYSEEKNFFSELLGNEKEKKFEFVVLKGLGYSSDYSGVDVAGKIVVIKRGVTTFEEKANVAEKMGAAGVIIYNNVSGEIKMNAGDTDIPLCSISQDDGELLAKVGNGTIVISKSNTAGPFMSDFSSWGPTPELGIKPEITAHGGSILSAVPGGGYDRISGTSMACPNISGVTALLRQYVKESFPDIANNSVEINKMVNRLMMSTADIILNKNGLPYAVRKQGAGLANLTNCKNTAAYLVAYNQDGSENDKPKIELGDDPTESGVYKFKFDVVNFSDSAQSYRLNTIILTESVSDTKTSHGETTVSEMAYELSGKATYKVDDKVATTVSVDAGATATVEVTITLSAADKKYLRDSFENGMYVEGFVTLDSSSGVDLSLPYLAFFGDWTVAPIFDLDYFETNKDELDDGIDLLDKNLPDAFSTRPIGGTENDFLSYLGSYYFDQNPNNPIIAADRNHISLSNQSESINSLRFVWAGMLRNAEKVYITIVEDSTGEVVFEAEDDRIRKAHGEGGPIQAANIDIEFSAIEQNLKNNTSYTVTLKAQLFEDEENDQNLNDTFTFPLVTDFEAPSLTGCEFYTEYDRSAKKNRLYVKMAVYDNHYAMSMQMGYLGASNDPEYTRALHAFDKYLTPIYSEKNSTTYVTYELTDYLDEISSSLDYYHDVSNRAFTVICYDYALNASFFEVELPDDFRDAAFDVDRSDAADDVADVVLRPNEVLDLTSPDPKNPIHTLVYPNDQWAELIEFESTNSKVCRVVGTKIVALEEGFAAIRIKLPGIGTGSSDETKMLYVEVSGRALSKPSVDYFKLTGFFVDYAHYFVNTEERSIGKTGDTIKFPDGKNYRITLYPGESVTAQYKLISYFPDDVEVVFESADSTIVTVDENGKITAKSEGSSGVTLKVLMDGKSTYYSQTIDIEVKEPWVTQGPSLTAYYGAGGRVEFPDRLAITDIAQFAFANYDYVLKEAWEEVSEEAPGLSKVWYYGDKRPDKITRVVIPEGIEKIGSYAFAGLTGLTEVVLPTTLETIDYGAFYGCTSLKTVQGLENVKFINQRAFEGCAIEGEINLQNAIAVSDYAFAGNRSITAITLGDSLQSIGASAFENNSSAKTITINSDIVKLGAYVFSGCSALTEMSVNAAVIPTGAFNECRQLATISLGGDVAVIGEYAFKGTKIARFEVASGNTTFTTSESGDCLLDPSETVIILVAPTLTSFEHLTATEVFDGAFSGNANLISVNLPAATSVGNYAFAHCASLSSVTLGTLTNIGSYAFMNTKISALPAWSADVTIGEFAFADTELTEVNITDGFTVPNGCFLNCESLTTVVIGNNVSIGEEAFALSSNNLELVWSEGGEYYYCVIDSPITSLTIGENCYIGDSAFYNATALVSVTIGNNAIIGDYAFYNAQSLASVHGLSSAAEIGSYAFSGDIYYVYSDASASTPKLDNNGNYIYTYFSTKLQSVDLSSLATLGESAFAYSKRLETVTLGDNLAEIPTNAFLASAVTSVIGLEGISEIGDYAFSECPLAGEINLSAIEKIGKYAFGHNDAVTSVTFPASNDKGVFVGEGAFVYCENLVTLNNTASLTEIDDFAFAVTNVTSADLSSVVTLGRQAFYKNEVCEFTVTISEKLTSIGDNPFANCIIAPFKTTVSEGFGSSEYESEVSTYDLNDNIHIINGSIYRVVPAGLELITYTGGASAEIPEGVVRISDMAFAGSGVVFVTLPESLRAIGHKAFYGCERLALVTFKAYNAPILEEEYDEAYFSSLQNIPATGEYIGYVDNLGNDVAVEGLGIIPYYMLNADFSPTNIFYGATFVDYIGHVEDKIAMVRPVNARGYDTFIFDQYFGTVIDGGAVKDAVTADAIEAISKLPDRITLADKALVEAARVAYNKILTNLQKSLVTNYSKLESAEKTISDLEYLQNQKPTTPEAPNTPDTPESGETPSEKKDYTVLILIISLGVSAVLIITLLVILIRTIVKKKQPKRKLYIRFSKDK